MKFLLPLLAFVFSSLLASAQITPKWIRYQSISPDGKQIAFTYKGDLYRVSASGGDAQQLTFHDAHDYMPVWSKDSKQIAFASDRYGNFDIYRMDAMGEPTSRWTKPTLSLINESMYSDGHCYASAYTELKIGKTVGMPVPGTCSFAGWEGLSDGTRWGVVPVSAKNMSGEWMENNQTEPMIEVKNMPGVIDKGRDQQLEKAIEELMKEVRG